MPNLSRCNKSTELGPEIVSNTHRNLAITGFEKAYTDDAINYVFFKKQEKDILPIIFWDFSSLENLQAIFSAYYLDSYKNELDFVSILFSLQAALGLAELVIDNLIKNPLNNEKIKTTIIPYLGLLAIFEFQKSLLIKLSSLQKVYEFTILRDYFIDFSGPYYKVDEIFEGEIREIDLSSETVWVRLRSLNNDETTSEPFSMNEFLKNDIEIEIDNAFYFIIYVTQMGDLTHQIEKIYI